MSLIKDNIDRYYVQYKDYQCSVQNWFDSFSPFLQIKQLGVLGLITGYVYLFCLHLWSAIYVTSASLCKQLQ